MSYPNNTNIVNSINGGAYTQDFTCETLQCLVKLYSPTIEVDNIEVGNVVVDSITALNTDINIPYENIDPENVSRKSMKPIPLNLNRNSTMEDMKNGYYILDVNETAKQGIPKYIFLGPEAPNMIYRP